MGRLDYRVFLSVQSKLLNCPGMEVKKPNVWSVRLSLVLLARLKVYDIMLSATRGAVKMLWIEKHGVRQEDVALAPIITDAEAQLVQNILEQVSPPSSLSDIRSSTFIPRCLSNSTHTAHHSTFSPPGTSPISSIASPQPTSRYHRQSTDQSSKRDKRKILTSPAQRI